MVIFFLASDINNKYFLASWCACMLCTWNVMQWESVFWSRTRISFFVLEYSVKTVRLRNTWRYTKIVIRSQLLHSPLHPFRLPRCNNRSYIHLKSFLKSGLQDNIHSRICTFLQKIFSCSNFWLNVHQYFHVSTFPSTLQSLRPTGLQGGL